LPAIRTARSFRPTASSFIASKLAPTARRLSVGARLARESGGAVLQAYRVIVHREQARSYSSPVVCWSEACPRIRRRGLSGLPRHRSSRASSLLQLAGCPLERGLPAIRTARSFRPTASSFIAGKLAPTARRISCGSGACPRYGRRGPSGLPRPQSTAVQTLYRCTTNCPTNRTAS